MSEPALPQPEPSPAPVPRSGPVPPPAPHERRAARVWLLIAAFAGFGLYLLVEGMGATALMDGGNPLGGLWMRLSGNIEPIPSSELSGISYDYRLKLPTPHWYLRTARALKKEGSSADRWLVHSDLNAHVIVLAQRAAPGSAYDVDSLAKALIDSYRANVKDFVLLDLQPLAGLPENGRIIHATSTSEGLPLEHYYGVFARNDRSVQLIAFSERSHFKDVQAELKQLIESFQFPPGDAPPRQAPAALPAATAPQP